ncbi:hypothetical protein [Methylobacterium planeticum]|uniref:hypothetical protein n=1 Tax=Methylobacterium planeticum TaxID=2615211 RepID=UPI00177CFFD8|nr:hypothetical protein [Methylobacterium planeticum]
MRKLVMFSAALAVAAAGFAVTMLTDPPVSKAHAVAQIDTYALTISANPSSGEPYDSN